MQKVLNFRDLGGIPTLDGRTVKRNLFYRSAMLNEATKADIEFLKELRLKLIFDYRDEDETVIIKKDPYGELGVKRLNIPARLNNEKLYRLQNGSFVSRIFAKFSMEDIKVSYRSLPFENQGYKAMVQALKDGETPFLQHCTAGKDRAGIGSAILLTILGASYDDILADYLKSIEIKSHIEEKAARYIPRPLRKFILKRLEPLFIVDKDLLQAARDAILERYGTIKNYLLEEFGLDADAIAVLRDRYTE